MRDRAAYHWVSLCAVASAFAVAFVIGNSSNGAAENLPNSAVPTECDRLAADPQDVEQPAKSSHAALRGEAYMMQQQPRGLKRGSSEHHDSRFRVIRLQRSGVEERDAAGLAARSATATTTLRHRCQRSCYLRIIRDARILDRREPGAN